MGEFVYQASDIEGKNTVNNLLQSLEVLNMHSLRRNEFLQKAGLLTYYINA